MDKDVLVTVSGLLFGTNEEGGMEDIEVIAPGEYYQKNGKHYVIYEELAEEQSEPVRNLLRISPDKLSIRKRGLVNAELEFELGNATVAHYSTPFGNLVLGIRARELKVQEEEKRINVDVEYALEVNYEHISDCYIKIQVQSKEGQDFSLSS